MRNRRERVSHESRGIRSEWIIIGADLSLMIDRMNDPTISGAREESDDATSAGADRRISGQGLPYPGRPVGNGEGGAGDGAVPGVGGAEPVARDAGPPLEPGGR